jgi:hypothetical protein
LNDATAVCPFLVIVALVADESINLLLWQVNKEVPDTIVSGVVGGVNVVVYKPVVLLTLKLLILPNKNPPTPAPKHPKNIPLLAPAVNAEDVV